MSSFIPEPDGQANIKELIQRIHIEKGSILETTGVDAIVTMLPATLEIEGTLNAAILQRAGPGLAKFIQERIIQPKPGSAYITPAFGMNVPYIIIGILPAWKTDIDRIDKDLIEVTRAAMVAVRETTLTKVAFPALGGGHYGYPPIRAARIMLRGITDIMSPDVKEVRIVCKQPELVEIFEERMAKIKGSI